MRQNAPSPAGSFLPLPEARETHRRHIAGPFELSPAAMERFNNFLHELHADAPHVHLADEPGPMDQGDTHGDHDWLQGATAAEVPAHLTMYTLPAAPAPHLRPTVRDESPPPDPGRGVPFRPPIA